MLDIRATHYVSPLSEVDFESVPLTVHLVNAADETGYITGKFRVYNDTTGLLIHTSDIAPLSLAAGAGADVTALTDFDPPSPADDVYFVIFDGNASNPLVPDGINFTLGAFYFDVKPVGMGPAPAAHAGTHEEGGADELEVSDLGTSELDDTLALSPDGAGGVEWVAVPAGVTDHGALTGLADDDHPQYRLRSPFFENDFLAVNSVFPWVNSDINSGYHGDYEASFSNQHPGTLYIFSSISANSGTARRLYPASLLLAGGESSTLIIRPVLLAGTTIRFGFIDTTSISDCVDGAYFEMAQVGGVDGVLVGKTSSNSTRSTTGTSYTLSAHTWYRFTVELNADATLASFTLYSEAGAVLWTDTLNTNIPTAAGRYTGNGYVCTNSGTTATTLAFVDYMSMGISRELTR